MQTLEASLKDLCMKKLISYDDALAKTDRPEDLKRMLSDVFI
jgi:Tfp pilus assembly pilus retraction ATPase PilT